MGVPQTHGFHFHFFYQNDPKWLGWLGVHIFLTIFGKPHMWNVHKADNYTTFESLKHWKVESTLPYLRVRQLAHQARIIWHYHRYSRVFSCTKRICSCSKLYWLWINHQIPQLKWWKHLQVRHGYLLILQDSAICWIH